MSDPGDFIIENGVLKKYVGPGGDVVIPEGVASIGKDAFREGKTEVPCSTLRRGFDYKSFREEGSLKSVTFPSSLRKIHDSAFQGCTALTALELPEELEEIGALAFFGCENLKEIRISESNPFFETIDGVLFRKQEKELLCYPAGKTDSSYTIPRGTEAVASNAFSRTPALEEIVVPNTVWRFEERAFRDPAPLMDKFTTYDMFFRSIQIEPGGKGRQVGKDVFNFRGGKSRVDYHRDDEGPLYYPGLPVDFVQEKPIRIRLALGFCTKPELYSEPYRSGYEAFSKANQNSLLKKAESIGLNEVKHFFGAAESEADSTKDFVIKSGILTRYTGLDSEVVIPNGVTEIGKNAFKGCSKLKHVTIPESVQTIGERAFSDCGLTEVTIPGGVSKIGKWAFFGCPIEKMVLSEGMQSFDFEALFGCKPKRLILPDSLTKLKHYDPVFYGIGLVISDLNRLPAPARWEAAICFAEDGGEHTDPRFENHVEFIRSKAGSSADLAAAHPAVLQLMCREKLIAPKNVAAYIKAVQKTKNDGLAALLENY